MGSRADSSVEPTGFDEFYREHFAEAARLAFLLTSSREAGQDLAQDAFVGLHRRWAHVQEPGPYVRRAVLNACRSYHRRRFLERRRNGAAVRESTDLHADELTDALAMLPYRQRAALVLRFYRDLPEDEIAAELGCRPGTVRSLVHRGLERLRKVIEP